jgi:homogentisate 1,2-dioxygenase
MKPGGGDSEAWETLTYQYGFGAWGGVRGFWWEAQGALVFFGAFFFACSSSTRTARGAPHLPLTFPRALSFSSHASRTGNEFTSEAVPGALPVGRNSPQVRCVYGWVVGARRGEWRRAASARPRTALTLTTLPSKKKQKHRPLFSPQICPFGLYAEQINGTPFTVPRR